MTFEEINISVSPCPASSPDLNPIEKVWNTMKRRHLTRQNHYEDHQAANIGGTGAVEKSGPEPTP